MTKMTGDDQVKWLADKIYAMVCEEEQDPDIAIRALSLTLFHALCSCSAEDRREDNIRHHMEWMLRTFPIYDSFKQHTKQ